MKYFIMTLLCLLCIEACNPTTSQPTSAPTRPTSPSPTATFPSPTPIAATPSPAPTTYPKLGDTITAWDSFYKTHQSLTAPGESLHMYSDEAADITVSYQDSLVNSITLTPKGDIQFSQLVLRYEPADSIYEGNLQAKNSVRYLYQSAVLAQLFPSLAFLDNRGAEVTPGTYSVLFTPTDSPQRILFLFGDMTLT